MICDKCGKNVDQLIPTPEHGNICEACFQEQFSADFKLLSMHGLIERVGGDDDLPPDKQRYRLTEKGEKTPAEEWDSIIIQGVLNRAACGKCSKIDPLIYSYRGKKYCHECFRPIAELVMQADDNDKRQLKEDDYIFFRGQDEETRIAVMQWMTSDLLIKVGRPEAAYAWLKCGFLHPDLIDEEQAAVHGLSPRDQVQQRFTEKELKDWEQAVRDYLDWAKVEKTVNSPELYIPQAEQWVLVNKLENGETAVFSKRGCIDVQTYEQVKDFLNVKLKPGISGYTPDGRHYGSEEVLGSNIIHCIGWEGVPRSDYDPKKHDTFHIRVHWDMFKRWESAGRDILATAGLLVDEAHPDTAFDVIQKLYDMLEAERRYDLLTELALAHPVVWTPDMMFTSSRAVDSLHDTLKVEPDVMFLNPMVWLFMLPLFNIETAEEAIRPVTKDGHIPFPDEMVGDTGFAMVGELFNLTDTQITTHYLYWDLVSSKLQVRRADLPIGSEPEMMEEQTTLKFLRFAASPYLIVQHHNVARHIRRRVESSFPRVSEGVGIILLRRAVSVTEATKPSNEAGSVEWSCQWWVSGHWTHQPCGAQRQDRRLTWIPPYIKGPPDKPLKEAVRLMVR